MDRLLINDLKVSAHLGVDEQERSTPQTLWIGLELAVDGKAAAQLDSVGATVDYAQLVQAVKRLIAQKSYQLLETMAEDVATLIRKQFQTRHVIVTIKKRALPDIDFAAIRIVRP